jgi:hypothetical protein
VGKDAGPLKVKDVTGDGVPDLLVVDDSGGSSGQMTYTLLSLRDPVEKTFSTDEWIGEMRWTLEDSDGDGVIEAVGPDFPMAIREEGSHYYGPETNVRLKYQEGKFVFDSRLMRHKPPPRNEFLAEVERAKPGRGDLEALEFSNYTSAMSDSAFAYALKLVYSGNGELAHQFVDLVFSDTPKNQRDYLWSCFYTNMMQDPYWSEISSMNHWSNDRYAIKGFTC